MSTEAQCTEVCRCDPERCDDETLAELDTCSVYGCALCMDGCPNEDCPHTHLLEAGCDPHAFWAAHRPVPVADKEADDAR